MKQSGLKFFSVLAFLLIQTSLSAQADSLTYEQYYFDFPFQEGIYTSFEEFKLNAPRIITEFEKRGADLYAWNDSLEELVLIDPNKIWGYSQAGNVYVSSEEAYWRILNFGQLSQFSAIAISMFRTVDSFGFPIEQESKSMQQLFLDMQTGERYRLTSENLAPYLEEQPLLQERFKKMKRKKASELILVLKAYNELNPIYFPVYE